MQVFGGTGRGQQVVRTVTDSDNYTVTTDYDNLDRKTKVTYPDGTFEQFQYTDNVTSVMTLDLTGSRDRRGLWTYRHYNGNEQMDSITDPANRITRYGYCTCGALTSITDPKNQTTTFNRDIQSRVYQKVFQDGTTIDYLYEGQTGPNTTGATSRLQSSTDAKSQRTNYLYFADDNIQQISYTNLAGQPLTPPTPTVSYSYDPNYNRISTMMDGTGRLPTATIPLRLRLRLVPASRPALTPRWRTTRSPSPTISLAASPIVPLTAQIIPMLGHLTAWDVSARK